jgi:hypothetical protein
MPDAGDLYAAAQELLQASIDSLDTNTALGLGGAPERAFVSAGAPALDCCDQLTVHIQDIREAPTQPLELGAGTRHKQNFWVNLIRFQVTITRCADLNAVPPSEAVLEAVAEQTDADGWALWNLLHNMVAARPPLLFSLCEQVYFDGLSAITPSGGCYGWVLTIRGEIDGYQGTPP